MKPEFARNVFAIDTLLSKPPNLQNIRVSNFSHVVLHADLVCTVQLLISGILNRRRPTQVFYTVIFTVSVDMGSLMLSRWPRPMKSG
jgi:hypothetical protein